MTITTIIALDEAMPAEPTRALESMALLGDLIGSHPTVAAHRRAAPMRVPGGYAVQVSTVLPKATVTRRVRGLIQATTDRPELFEVSSR